MNINFDDYDKSYNEFFGKSVQELMLYLQPILRQVEFRKEENKGIKKYNVNNEYKETNIKEYEVMCTIDFSTIENTDIEEYLLLVYSVASDYSTQLAKTIIEEIDKTCIETGNTINSEGKELSYSIFLDLLEKMEIKFDDNRNPIKPTLILNPKTLEKLNSINPTKEELKREQEIYAKKKEEYYAKKHTRRLY